MKDKTDDTKDKLIWKWIKGTRRPRRPEFGDPTDATSYALCVYGGPGAALIDGTVVPPSASAWQTTGSTGYKYKSALPGVQKIGLRGSATDKSKVLVKGRGIDLPDLSPPVATPLVVQLVNARNGLCWGSTYQGADLLKNDSGLLKGKTP